MRDSGCARWREARRSRRTGGWHAERCRRGRIGRETPSIRITRGVQLKRGVGRRPAVTSGAGNGTGVGRLRYGLGVGWRFSGGSDVRSRLGGRRRHGNPLRRGAARRRPGRPTGIRLGNEFDQGQTWSGLCLMLKRRGLGALRSRSRVPSYPKQILSRAKARTSARCAGDRRIIEDAAVKLRILLKVRTAVSVLDQAPAARVDSPATDRERRDRSTHKSTPDTQIEPVKRADRTPVPETPMVPPPVRMTVPPPARNCTSGNKQNLPHCNGDITS
jgi:hypothetical protein